MCMVWIDLVMEHTWKSAMLLLNVKNVNLLVGGWVVICRDVLPGRSNNHCTLFSLIVLYCRGAN